MDIQEKTVLITGGANGIGRCLVQHLVESGAEVGVLDVDQLALDSLHDQYPSVYVKNCNICDEASVSQAVDEFFSSRGRINILINNAGIIRDCPLISLSRKLERHSYELWKQVIDVNLNSVFIVSSYVVEKMILKRTRGLIINVSSISAHGNPGQSAYAAAKAGVAALTRTWAKELNGFGIRVACIAPGFTGTDSAVKAMGEKITQDWAKRIPIKRLAEPDEIASGIMFIISNDYFNGKTLELDGGVIL